MVDKGRAEECINGEHLDYSDPATNKEIIDSYEHQYGTVYVHCFFASGLHNRVVSWFSLVAPLRIKTDLLAIFGPAPMSNACSTVSSLFFWVPIDIRTQYVRQLERGYVL